MVPLILGNPHMEKRKCFLLTLPNQSEDARLACEQHVAAAQRGPTHKDCETWAVALMGSFAREFLGKERGGRERRMHVYIYIYVCKSLLCTYIRMYGFGLGISQKHWAPFGGSIKEPKRLILRKSILNENPTPPK